MFQPGHRSIHLLHYPPQLTSDKAALAFKVTTSNKVLTLAECAPCGKTSSVRLQVDAIDEANMKYLYSLVGGNGLDPSFEKVSLHTKVRPGPYGGSIGEITVKYYTKGDAVPSDAVIEKTKAKGAGLFNAIEHYLYEKC